MTPEFTEGQEFTLTVPFWVATVRAWDGSADDHWVLGTHPDYDGEDLKYADGEGSVTYRVIAQVELPAPYQPRVFYRRHFLDPDGNVRGKPTADVRTLATFRRYTQRGWRSDYKVQGQA